MEIIEKNINDLIPYEFNNKIHDVTQIDRIANSIKEFWFLQPVVIDKNNIIIVWHGRVEWAKKLWLENVPCVQVENLTEAQIKKYRILDNKLNESERDVDNLKIELEELGDFDIWDLEISVDELFPELLNLEEETEEIKEDEVPIVNEKAKVIELWDLIQLWNHRLLCGDSTNLSDFETLLDWNIADLVFTDPPYWMKKEKKWVLNDNLNYEDLLEFNKERIPLSFAYLKDNWSRYCWGIDEPLMDIYSNILKPMQKEQKLTFRNLITWDKWSWQWQLSELFRMYPIADEKCLFVMCGVQWFNNNADNYFEAREPIREYLYNERIKCWWDIPTMKTIAWHSDKSRDHWTGKSQFNLPTREVYERFQNWAKENNVDAFKKEYDEIKKEYYSTRAYFDNLHDNQNNVRHFNKTSWLEKKETWWHATPKPLALCERAIKSSSREDEIVLDCFGGSWSTLIACEQLNRKCYMMELDPKYCEVIIKRFHKINPDGEIKCLNREINIEEILN